MDRFEWRDRYAMNDGTMALIAAGDSGSASNRVESARALAGHVRAALHFGAWTFTPGVRHERIDLSRVNYGDDLDRATAGTERTNEVDVWLPGLGVHVDVVPGLWTAFAGVHRGFMPPGSAPETEAEFSTNLEVGSRLSTRASGQITVFHSDRINLLGTDLTANGGTGSGIIQRRVVTRTRRGIRGGGRRVGVDGRLGVVPRRQIPPSRSDELHLHRGGVHAGV